MKGCWLSQYDGKDDCDEEQREVPTGYGQLVTLTRTPSLLPKAAAGRAEGWLGATVASASPNPLEASSVS